MVRQKVIETDCRVATDQEMVRDIKFLKVMIRVKSGNYILSQGKLAF